MHRLLFVGAPGVGKGTYAGRAAAAMNLVTISSGELLRKEVAEESEIGKRVKGLIERGVFVPDDLIAEMMVKRVKAATADSSAGGYILDGFPRNVAQATSLWGSGEIKIDYVINLTQPRNVIVTKLSSRRSCADCGFVYNVATINEGGIKMDPLLPKVEGVCDHCGSTKPFVVRKDDELEVVKKRQDDYDNIARPLLDFYKEKGVLREFPVLGGTKEYLPKLLEMLKGLH